MTDRIAIKEMLISEEGIRNKPYVDTVGKLTIGVGRNLDDVGLRSDEIMMLLNNDIEEVIEQAQKFDWYATMDDIRQSVVIGMIFQLGLAGFKNFKKTVGFLSHHAYVNAAAEMLDSKWARDDSPERAKRMSQMMATGNWVY